MAPGAFSLLAPFLRRRNKKYEKLETEEPERRRQEAAVEELHRINHKIDKLVSSITSEDFEPPTGPGDECLGCGECKAVMQVSPCGHQSLCRLCFIKNIQEAVSSRQLPLCCVLCHCRIQRVKNTHRTDRPPSRPHPRARPLPTSVSGYELPALSKAHSNYSVHSALSTSSCGSARSARSSSCRSLASLRSSTSSSSWFSINSLSSFQVSSMDKSSALSKPRPHSLTNSRHRLGLGTHGPSRSSIPQSYSSPAIRSLAGRPEPTPQARPSSSHSAHNLSSACLQPSRPPAPPPPAAPRPPEPARPPAPRPAHARRRVKSPEVAETTFTMSTIEEEMEGVSIRQEPEA